MPYISANNLQTDADPDPQHFVDQYHADSDMDSAFRFYADPEPDPDPRFTHVGISELFLYFFHSGASLHCFYLSLQRHRCHNFQYFGENIEICWK
jgi:hypothetical protein